MHLISTDSGDHYDLHDHRSALRYIAEQKLSGQPSHVLALVYGAIEHLGKLEKALSRCGDNQCHCRHGEPCPKEDHGL